MTCGSAPYVLALSTSDSSRKRCHRGTKPVYNSSHLSSSCSLCSSFKSSTSCLWPATMWTYICCLSPHLPQWICIANNHQSPHYKANSRHKTNLIFSLSFTTHVKKPLWPSTISPMPPFTLKTLNPETEHVAFAILKLTFDINND